MLFGKQQGCIPVRKRYCAKDSRRKCGSAAELAGRPRKKSTDGKLLECRRAAMVPRHLQEFSYHIATNLKWTAWRGAWYTANALAAELAGGDEEAARNYAAASEENEQHFRRHAAVVPRRAAARTAVRAATLRLP